MTTGNVPSVRKDHGSAVIEDNLYIFGGFGDQAYKDNSLYSLNTTLA